MQWSISTILFTVFGFALAASPALAEEPGCVTSKCHETMGTAEWVHGPVGVGECGVCHSLEHEKDHRFALRAAGGELCFACHEGSRDMMLMDNLHTPVAEGNCVGCHDPHQSDHRFSLKAAAADLCLSCHERAPFAQANVHGPVASGDCTVCHDPHASPNPRQLVEPVEGLCFLCHEELADALQMRHIHPPVEEGCTTCHDPHSSPAEFGLPLAPPELCLTCHEEMESATTAATQHPPAANGECLSCHNPHGTDFPSLAAMPPQDLCFSCHEDMAEFITGNEHLHGPVKDGDCAACHNPHGSDNQRILRKYFPTEFYKPYEEENYALCFECHNRQIAVSEETTTLTDFRDKERNLHFLHVNKDVKGRSCRACHQVHASNQEKHVRPSVPFGKVKWELPVTFTKTQDGGSCRVGCHARKEYSRK